MTTPFPLPDLLLLLLVGLHRRPSQLPDGAYPISLLRAFPFLMDKIRRNAQMLFGEIMRNGYGTDFGSIGQL